MKIIRQLLANLVSWLYLQCIAHIVLVRPKNLTINGTLRGDFGSQLSLDRSSQVSIGGNLKLRKSKIIVHGSQVSLNDTHIDNSVINLQSSSMYAQSGLHISSSNARINKSQLALGSRFRICGVPLFLNSSTLTTGHFNLITQERHYAPSIRLNNAQVTFGENVNLKCDLVCEGSLFELGDNVFINRGTEVRCFQRITIGNNVFISYECVLFDTNTHAVDPDKRFREIQLGFPNQTQQDSETIPETKPIVIGSNVWIGMRAAILKGADIGESAVIGFGAVVTGAVPGKHLAIGNPFLLKKIPERHLSRGK